jgi:hypothetical protein
MLTTLFVRTQTTKFDPALQLNLALLLLMLPVWLCFAGSDTDRKIG